MQQVEVLQVELN